MVCVCKLQLSALSGPLASAKLNFAVQPPAALMKLSAQLALHAPLPQLDPALLDALKNATIPPVTIGPGIGTLSGLANAAVMIKATLGINPLAPNAALSLQQALGTLGTNFPALRLPPLPMPALSNLSSIATAVATIRANLHIDPLAPNAQLALNEAIGTASAPMPTLPPFVLPKLQLIAGFSPLLSLAAHLGVNLGAPNALHALAAHIRALVGLKLPGLTLPANFTTATLPHLSALAALANIHANLGLNLTDPAAAQQAGLMLSHLARLTVPPLPALPHLPNLPTIKAVLGLGPAMGPLAGLKWAIPSFNALPLLNSILPAVSLVAQLQALAPHLGLPNPVLPSPCAGGCPLA